MNYLAHFHVAAGDQALIIGALLGDFVKGPLRGEYPERWETGISLHRRIDAWIDTRPEVIELLAALPPGYRRYGGIMLDVCFDHCLSRRWGEFHPESLPRFAENVYGTLAAVQHRLPPAARRQAERLSRYDVLSAMRDWRTVENMLAGIGLRLRGDNPLDCCGEPLKRLLPEIEAVFLRLYPSLRSVREEV